MIKENIIELERKWAELLKGPKRANEPKTNSTKITAAELQAQLLQDEEYQKWLKKKEEVRTALETAYAEYEKPLVDELVQAGLNVTSSWDLVNTKSSYKAAIPILVKHLSMPYYVKNKEGIVRALAVREAKRVACRAIIDEYHKAPKDDLNYRWAFGNTMAVIMTPEYIEDVIAIVQDKSNGESRQMFVAALGKLKSQRAGNALIDLLNDDEVVLDALRALAKLKSAKAIERISLLLNHPNPSVMKEARKTLKKVI